MRKILLFVFILFSFTGSAQIPVIGTLIGKVIKAIDLKVQKLQNETIWLQNAQKEIENNLHKLKLEEIRGWTDKQRALYENYFAELKTVKQSVSSFALAKNILGNQAQLVSDYKQSIAAAKSSGAFSFRELDEMGTVYSGILQRSLYSLNQLQIALGQASMNDAERLIQINHVSQDIDSCLSEVAKISSRVKQVSDTRLKEKTNIELTRKIYGIR